MEVAQSMTNGNFSSVGMPKHRGFVPAFEDGKGRKERHFTEEKEE